MQQITVPISHRSARALQGVDKEISQALPAKYVADGRAGRKHFMINPQIVMEEVSASSLEVVFLAQLVIITSIHHVPQLNATLKVVYAHAHTHR